MSGVFATATGYRDFGDCAVFIDFKANTCAVVTTSTSPLDFVLKANVSTSQNLSSVGLALKDGDCSDTTQVTKTTDKILYYIMLVPRTQYNFPAGPIIVQIISVVTEAFY